MIDVVRFPVVLLISLAVGTGLVRASDAGPEAERQRLLELHDQQRRAHLEKDVEPLLSMLADDFVSIEDGVVERPGREALRQRFERYFAAVEFLEWSDSVPPEITISADGTFATMVVQKRVRSRPATQIDAAVEETRFAWLETWRKREGGWELVALASTDRVASELQSEPCQCFDPDWSLDGRSIAFVRECNGNGDIYTVHIDGTDLTRITTTPGTEHSPAWSPDGTRLAYAYAPGDGDREIWTMAADGSDARAVTDNESSESGPTWSPDGKRLAYESLRNDNADIWVLDLTSGTEKRLTRSSDRDVGPSWSPDGETIAFQSNREGRYMIYGVSPEGEEARLLMDLPGDAVIPDWSPDGSRIAFAYQAPGEENTDIWVAGADGSDPVPVTDNERVDFFPKWSPDGERISFMTRETGSWDIFVASVDGTGEHRLHPCRKR